MAKLPSTKLLASEKALISIGSAGCCSIAPTAEACVVDIVPEARDTSNEVFVVDGGPLLAASILDEKLEAVEGRVATLCAAGTTYDPELEDGGSAPGIVLDTSGLDVTTENSGEKV